MTDAIQAYGSLLKMGDGATPTEAFATVAEVKDISGPGWEADQIEVTNHSSPGAFKEYIAGLLDGGEVTFDVNFIPSDATHDETTGLISVLLARATRNFKLVWPTSPATAVGFEGQVTGFETSEPVDEELSASVTIKVSGAPDFAATP